MFVERGKEGREKTPLLGKKRGRRDSPKHKGIAEGERGERNVQKEKKKKMESISASTLTTERERCCYPKHLNETTDAEGKRAMQASRGRDEREVQKGEGGEKAGLTLTGTKENQKLMNFKMKSDIKKSINIK